MSESIKWLRCFATAAVLLASGSQIGAATLFESTELLAGANAPTLASPVLTFEVPVAGDYTVTLTDLQTPAPLTTLQALLTRDLQAVSTLALSYAGGATPTPASAAFTASAGRHRLHVLGIAAANVRAGSYAVRVTPTGGGAAVLDTAASLSANSQVPSNTSVLQTEFSITQAGTYELALTDHAFPVALASTQLAVLQPPNAPIITAPGQFTATPGTYSLIVIATAETASQAGLYSLVIEGGPANARVFQTTRAVGRMPASIDMTVPSGSLELTVADSAFPSALARVGAVIVQGNALLGRLDAAGSTTMLATSGPAQLFTTGAATAEEGVGTYSVRLAQGSSALHESMRIVDNSPDPRSPAIHSVVTPNALVAGEYRVVLKDVAFPAAFPALRALVTQGASVVGRMNVAGEQTFTMVGGPARIIIASRTAAGDSMSLFALSLSRQSDGVAVLETTQGVGGLFHSAPVTIQSAGRYDLTLADLQFPASLASSAVAVTQGTSLVGQIFGGGSLAGQNLSPGVYVLNFQGVPGSAAMYGAYGLRVADSAPAPTLTFTATPTSVRSGQQATLSWSATNATSCTASNGWTGAKTSSGSQSVGPLFAPTMFELTCNGPGGSVDSSVSVSLTAPSRRGGGGGELDAMILIALSLLATVRIARPRALR